MCLYKSRIFKRGSVLYITIVNTCRFYGRNLFINRILACQCQGYALNTFAVTKLSVPFAVGQAEVMNFIYKILSYTYRATVAKAKKKEAKNVNYVYGLQTNRIRTFASDPKRFSDLDLP